AVSIALVSLPLPPRSTLVPYSTLFPSRPRHLPPVSAAPMPRPSRRREVERHLGGRPLGDHHVGGARAQALVPGLERVAAGRPLPIRSEHVSTPPPAHSPLPPPSSTQHI